MSSLTYDDDVQLDEFDRVRHMSSDKANRSIDASTRESIERATAGGRDAIERRLTALQQEWDIDRVLMVNFATLVFAQLVAATRDRRWLWGPLARDARLVPIVSVVPAHGIPHAVRKSSRARRAPSAFGRPAGLTGSRRIGGTRAAAVGPF